MYRSPVQWPNRQSAHIELQTRTQGELPSLAEESNEYMQLQLKQMTYAATFQNPALHIHV